MICVTGAESTVNELVSRIERLEHFPLQEIRLDFLETPNEEWKDLKTRFSLSIRKRWIVTCRPPYQGGSFKRSEKERIQLLTQVMEDGVGMVDLEWEAGAAALTLLLDAAEKKREKEKKGKVLLSHHIFEPTWDQADGIRILEAMEKSPAPLLKLALAIDDVAQLKSIQAMAQKGFQKPLVLIPMGDAGVIGRVFYDRLNSPWTYVTASQPTAPGQFCLETLERMGFGLESGASQQNGGPKGPLLVLFGGQQVQSSFGPPVYNDLFRKQGLSHIYLPAPTKDVAKAVDSLRPFSLWGAAVTMPHKNAAAKVAEKIVGEGKILHSINTLYIGDKGQSWEGQSTDGDGVVSALAPHVDSLKRDFLEGKQNLEVVILGAGGAAVAATWALHQAGAQVTMVVRDPKRPKRRSIP